MVCQITSLAGVIRRVYCFHCVLIRDFICFKDEVQNIIRKEAIYVKSQTIKEQALPIEVLRKK